MMMRKLHGFVSGRVQAVGFRYFLRQQAEHRQVAGYARNLADGRVEFALQGEAEAVGEMLQCLQRGPAHAQVTDLEYSDDDTAESFTEFSIR